MKGIGICVPVILSFALSASVSAQVVFFADFEAGSRDAVPNAGVNDLGNWANNAPGQIIQVADHPKNGSKAFKITVEGCGNSGSFDLPGVDDFTDGLIQVEMNAGDDDSFGVVFRRSGNNSGYLVVFGTVETPAVIVAGLDICGGQGQCLDQMACENNPGNTLGQVPHGMAIGIANNMDMLGRVEAQGDTIRVWYVPLDDVDDVTGDLGAPILEVQDNAFKGPGKVGLWHESMSSGYFDNVLVAGPAFLSVGPNGKTAMTWGDLKSE